MLRGKMNAPWYTRNSGIYRDLHISFVTEDIKKNAVNHNQFTKITSLVVTRMMHMTFI